jgi:deazaflavin-dependent oxidoreductase (nitroreductase family)
MSLAATLGITAPRPNVMQRAIQVVASSKPGAWVLQRTMYRFDRPLMRRTNGRVGANVLSGLPMGLFTTTGAKSGELRVMPLAFVPVGDTIAVFGTNYGQKHTPGWVYNLLAHPRAVIDYRGVRVEVTARLAEGAEEDAAWQAAGALYRGFPKYRERITGRTPRVFILEPVDA